MKVRLQQLIPLSVALVCAAVSHPAQAQDPNAHLYLGNAVPGRNISTTTNPEYPVDISMGGHCIAQGLSFGETRGPYTTPPGTYAFSISVANALSPCSSPAFFSASLSLVAGGSYMGMASLNSSNQATGTAFAVDLSAVPVGQSRLIVFNTTKDNLTGVFFVGDSTTASQTSYFNAGTQVVFNLPNGEYSETLYQGSTVATGPFELGIGSRSVYVMILAGSAANGSVQVVGPQVIKDVY